MAEAFERIPMLDLTPEIDFMWDDLMKAVQDVLRSGQFILGPQVEAFEEEVAAYLGVKHAIGVNSGTDAIMIALRALGVGPGDEVITTSFTFFATAEAISNVGATPVFVDIDPKTFNIDPALIEPAITDRTKAIVPVHLYGQAADMDPIMDIALRHGLNVVEDVAQAMGGEYKGRKNGSLGDAGAFSFFPTKNLGGFGDGGLVGTNDDSVADTTRMLRAHGSRKKYANEALGYNSRLDEMHAALLRVRLRYLDEWTWRRREVAAHYADALRNAEGIVLPVQAEGREHVYHQYTVRVRDGRRDFLKEFLFDSGIQTAVYYPVPCNSLPIYVGQHRIETTPQADAAASEVLSLPIGPLRGEFVPVKVAETMVKGLAQSQ